MARRKKSKARPLLSGYLERISSRVFDRFPEQLTELVGSEHGIYALYKKDRLYYVGLASNLKRRIRHHMKDRHSGEWDRFSVYLVRKSDHIKELESLILRIVDPSGNVVTGKLSRSENLQSFLEAEVKNEQNRRREELFGKSIRRRRTSGGQKKRARPRTNVRKTKDSLVPALAPYVKSRFRIYGEYKGKTFKAALNKSGTIRFGGFSYNTPSGAAEAARKCRTNGWTFWKFRNSKDELVAIDQLRKKKR